MIRGYSDHAANERTFLAWLRTSIAVIAFGFVVEKFNLFALTLLDSTSLDDAHRTRLERLSGSLPQGAGRAFIAVGVITIVLATIRFVRTGWLLALLFPVAATVFRVSGRPAPDGCGGSCATTALREDAHGRW